MMRLIDFSLYSVEPILEKTKNVLETSLKLFAVHIFELRSVLGFDVVVGVNIKFHFSLRFML